MKEFQKIIKYAAIAFALYLSITIIGAIVGGVLAISTGIYGASVIMEQKDIERVDVTKEFEQFNKLDLEIAASNLTIKTEGNQFKVETYRIPKTTKIEVDNGTLKIRDNKKIINSQESNIIIYIPEETIIEDIKLEMGAGTVNLNKINSEKIHFSFGAGSVNIRELIAKEARIECGAGQVIIEDTDLTNAKLDSGVGKLVYSGYMRGRTKIDSGIGEVILNLEGGSEIYTIEAEKGIGDIRINNESVPNETIKGNGENKISIDGGIGSIQVNM